MNTLAPTSPWRSTAEFKQIVHTWAESQFRIAETKEVGAKKAVLQRIEREPTLDEDQKKRVLAELAALESTPVIPPESLPNVTKDAGPTSTVPVTSGNVTVPPVAA